MDGHVQEIFPEGDPVGDSPKRGFFEWFTQLLVPLAALVATIAVSLQQKPRTIVLSLIGVAFLSLLISEAPRARKWFEQWRLRRKERAVSATAFEDLKGRIHKFEEFASTRRNDTLYLIVFSNLCQSNQTNFDNLHLVPPMLFCEMWELLRNRINAMKPSVGALRESVSDFNFLVANFCRYLACSLYERVPSKLSPEMLTVYTQQRVEKDLIQFRERFDRFLGEYMDFLKDADRKLPQPLNLGYYFERPKPLTTVSVQSQASLSLPLGTRS